MQNKDNKKPTNLPTFNLENVANYTILIQEYEYLEIEKMKFLEEHDINLARQRQILKQIGAEKELSISKSQKIRFKLAADSVLKQKGIVYEFLLFIKSTLSNVEKELYQEKLEAARLKEELRRIRLLSN